MKISARLLHARAGLAVLLLASAGAAQAQAAATQAPEAIVMAAQTYLQEQLASLPGQASIAIDPPRTDRLAPCDTLSPFLPSGMKLRSRMTVGVRCNAAKGWTAYVQATVSVAGHYYVASRLIAAGQALTPADLDARDGDALENAPPGAVVQVKTAGGQVVSGIVRNATLVEIQL